MGWIGTRGQVVHFLRVVGADRGGPWHDFHVRGDIVIFMGIDQGDHTETVVADNVEYRIGGKWANLAVGLGGTSYGLKVHVI